MYKQFIFTLFLNYICLAIFAQAPDDICENKVPGNWFTGSGKLSVSETHFKQGQQSICWNWNSKKASLQIIDTAFSKALADKKSCFTIWIYNEKPLKDSLEFSFGKNDCSFSFQLNFKGWRTAWVMYNRDMKGTPSETMNSLKILAPVSVKNGTLYFDAMQYVTTVDPRAPMRDMQAPFIHPVNGNNTANAHWVNLLQFSQLSDFLKVPKTVFEKEIADIETIQNRYEKIVLPAGSSQKNQIKAITKSFEAYSIKSTG
ncbi:MAG: chondroitinase family protein, partial [Ginsengibacter sp.]